ncbi:hypothetical protein JCM8547_000842 [Rhodosporidiobolus lusitaniae]
MDELRCNNLRCRKSLALEVSRSHIFCVDCANALFSTPQVCPACETSLTDMDDIMQTALNPHDSYKTSILSGLPPTIVLDIASRALNFYTYQVQQEAAFQALITKNAQERISILEAQLNTVTREANAEIALLKDRVGSAEKDLDLERRRVRELQETHKANAKAYSKLKAQYDKTKQRALLNPGDPNLQQAFNPASGGPPAPSPSIARQAFIPAPGTGPFIRSTSSASHPGRGGGGIGAGSQQLRQSAGWNASGGQHALFTQHGAAPGSSSRRRPLQEQPGGGNAFLGGGGNGGVVGNNNTRKLSLANATGLQPGDGMPQFLGQHGGRAAGGGGARGVFSPANFEGSRNST